MHLLSRLPSPSSLSPHPPNKSKQMTESPLIYLLNHLSNSGSWAGNYPRCHRVRGRVYLGQVYNRDNTDWKATNLELVTLTCVTVGGWHWEKLRRYRENMLHTKMAQLTRKDKLCFEARLLTTVSTCHSSSKMSIIKQSKYIKTLSFWSTCMVDSNPGPCCKATVMTTAPRIAQLSLKQLSNYLCWLLQVSHWDRWRRSWWWSQTPPSLSLWFHMEA